MAKKLMSCQKFVTEVQDRLSVIYGKSADFSTGKNTVTFNVNKFTATIEKSKNKDTGERKTFVELDDMYPVIIRHNSSLTDFKYTEKDVNQTVYAIDKYLMSRIGYNFKSAICADYSMLKWALLPMLLGDTNDAQMVIETQRTILEIMAVGIEKLDGSRSAEELEAEDKKFAFFYAFKAKDIYTDEENQALIFQSEHDKLIIHKVLLIDGMISSRDKDLTTYVLELDEYPGIQMMTAVKKLFKNLYDFKLCAGKFEKIITDNDTENKHHDNPIDDELITELIKNKMNLD